MPGPLSSIRVIELAAIGPVPFCGMLLSDMGADVIRVDRASGGPGLGELAKVCGRGKRSIALDLKSAGGRRLLLDLGRSADILIEGFRPGVAERLGVGPDDLLEVNPGLIYGRMTGWGREGPMAQMAGHDINYIGLVGALGAIGGYEPVVPLNLVADYGGGAMYLAVGVLAALAERSTSGRGQVVDAAMIDGAASLMTIVYQLAGAGHWVDARRSNYLDGAAPFYRTYQTSDGGFMAVGALEPQFFARLLELLELDATELPGQHDRSGWPELTRTLAAVFAAAPRAHWEALFTGEDACVTPVYSLAEAPHVAQNVARGTFMSWGGHDEPAPAPRFGRTPGAAANFVAEPGDHTVEILGEMGIDGEGVAALATSGVLGTVTP